jgi:hypothetical protein
MKFNLTISIVGRVKPGSFPVMPPVLVADKIHTLTSQPFSITKMRTRKFSEDILNSKKTKIT